MRIIRCETLLVVGSENGWQNFTFRAKTKLLAGNFKKMDGTLRCFIWRQNFSFRARIFAPKYSFPVIFFADEKVMLNFVTAKNIQKSKIIGF